MIIRLLQENPSLSANAFAEKIGITLHVVERHISKLKADGILFRNGADNGGSWVILSDGKKRYMIIFLCFALPCIYVFEIFF